MKNEADICVEITKWTLWTFIYSFRANFFFLFFVCVCVGGGGGGGAPAQNSDLLPLPPSRQKPSYPRPSNPRTPIPLSSPIYTVW